MKACFAAAAVSLLVAFGVTAQTINVQSRDRVEGHQLAQRLAEEQPEQNLTTTGVLKIHADKGSWENNPITFRVILTPTNWASLYQAGGTNQTQTLLVVHTAGQRNAYFYETNAATQVPLLNGVPVLGHLFKSRGKLSGSETVEPFAGSDFWLCDLGLEFFHWPEQKTLPNPTNLKRGRSYTLLESINPYPATNGYSRVLSWIDQETGGILQAEAYDAQGKLLKEFSPKSFKKVNGQWQLQEMEIDNVQTGSRTRLEFDLPK